MIRLGIVLALAAGLAGLAILEQSLIQGAYRKLDEDVAELSAVINATPDYATIATDENIAKITEMYEWWLKQERRLSMLARHFDLAQVSDSLIYAKNFIIFDNKEEANVGLLKLHYLIKTHSFNIGTSIQNVI